MTEDTQHSSPGREEAERRFQDAEASGNWECWDGAGRPPWWDAGAQLVAEIALAEGLDELQVAELARDVFGQRLRRYAAGCSARQCPQREFLAYSLAQVGDAAVRRTTVAEESEAVVPGGSSAERVIRRLPKMAFVRMEAATAAFMAEYLPKLEREANRYGPVHDAELLRELVIHQFGLVARECMAVCDSVEHFESELRSDIASLVHHALSHYPWLSASMRGELDTGFALFVTRANPWTEISETDRASILHVGATTGEALSHLALKLRAEAWQRAAAGGFAPAGRASTPEPSKDESVCIGVGPSKPEPDSDATKRRAAVDRLISRTAEAGRKITRKDVWSVAGYKDRTEFERFQRCDIRTTRSAITSFNRVLNMEPEDFIRALEKKTKK